MNPRTDYEEADSTTVRAYVELFRRLGDEFRFPVDGNVDPVNRAEPTLVPEDNTHDRSTIGFVTVDDEDIYNRVRSELEDMGVEILGEKEVVDEADGEEHTIYSLRAAPPEDIDRDWNVPHLIVYGWLRPELEEVVAGAFPQCEYEDIRNHYVIYGAELADDAKVDLSSAISRHRNFTAEIERDLTSDVHTADMT